VFAWLVVELGDAFADAVRDAAAYLGTLVDTEAFVQTLNFSEAVVGRQVGSANVSAHSICALLNIHMLVPYIFIALLVLVYASALVFVVAGSLFPLFLLISKVFATVSTGDERESIAENEDFDAESES
jgi:tetrahydromethanopterin S-methyltransferase subunit E